MSYDVAATLAQVLPDPSSGASAGWLFVALGSLAVVINQLLGAMKNFRALRGPDPASPQDTARLKALEEDMKALELRMERRLGETLGGINTRLQSLESTISHLVSDFSRSLGVLEGKAGAVSKDHP